MHRHAARLRGGLDQNLIDVYVGWPRGGEDNAVGDVGSTERLHSAICGGRTILVSVVPNQAELGVDQTWVHRTDTDAATQQLVPEGDGDGAFGMLGPGVYAAPRVAFVA